jgi:transcriptional regulator with XRE-family HTH domain
MSRSNEQTILIDKFVGKKILDFRISRGIPRKAMAEAIGVTHQQLQKYEYATNRISASRLVLVAQYLEVPVIEFFESFEINLKESDINHRKFLSAISKKLSHIKNENFKEAINQLVKAYIKIDEKN